MQRPRDHASTAATSNGRSTTVSSPKVVSNNNNSSSSSTTTSHTNNNTNRGVRFGPDVDHSRHNNNNNNNTFFGNEPFTMSRIVDSLFGVITAWIASWCIVGLCLILAVLYVTVRPFSKSTYRRLAAVWGGAALVDAITLLLPNCRIYLTGDSDIPSPVGSSVLVANHIVPADWWAIFLLGRCVGLRGNLKVFLRNEFLQVNIENVDSNSRSSTTGTGSSATHTNGGSTSMITNGNNAGGASGGGGFIIPHQPHPQSSRGSPTFTTVHADTSSCRKAAPDLSLMAKLLHLFLEFPLINGEDYTSDREQLFTLLRSFSSPPETSSPVHLLLYPECWSMHNGTDRKSVHAKSNGFAKREGKPTLKHLLLPRTRGFNASLECLRESSPVVYDVTMAYNGYDGALPPVVDLSLTTLWDILRRKFPREVHLRLKRYSMEEVIQDSNWLCKTWAEKDRLLSHFVRHGQFPVDTRGYCRHRVFDTRTFSLETSIVSFVRLLLVPCAVPILLLLSVPLFWIILTMWMCQYIYRITFRVPMEEPIFHPDDEYDDDGHRNPMMGGTEQRTPGSASSTTGTPFFPATPFASPLILNWRDMFTPNDNNNNNDNNKFRRTR